MAITLPYNFNTVGVWQGILKKGSWLLGIIGVGIVYSLVLRRFASVFGMIVVGAMIVWIRRLFFDHSDGSIGTLTGDAVTVRPGEMYGHRLPGPSGEFALRRFKSVRIDRFLTPGSTTSPDGYRVYLVGDSETPSILIARAVDIGREIAGLLQLPCEEKFVAY